MATIFAVLVGIAIGAAIMAVLRPAPVERIMRAYHKKGDFVPAGDVPAIIQDAVEAAIKNERSLSRKERAEAIQFCIDLGRKLAGQSVVVTPLPAGVRLVKVVSASELMEVIVTPNGWRVVSGKAEWERILNGSSKAPKLPQQSEDTRPALPAGKPAKKPKAPQQKTVIQSSDPMDDPNYWASYDQQ